jgi:hypothetical protein
MTENKRKDWTKVEVETIKENLPKILLVILLVLPLILIGYLGWIGLSNAENANSGITVENKNYETTPNITESGKNPSENNGDISSTSDLLKLFLAWFPILFVILIGFKLFSKISDWD